MIDCAAIGKLLNMINASEGVAAVEYDPISERIVVHCVHFDTIPDKKSEPEAAGDPFIKVTEGSPDCAHPGCNGCPEVSKCRSAPKEDAQDLLRQMVEENDDDDDDYYRCSNEDDLRDCISSAPITINIENLHTEYLNFNY